MDRFGRILILIGGKVSGNLQNHFRMLQTRGQYKVRSELSATSRSFKQGDIHPMGMEFIYPEWSFTEYFSKFSMFKTLCNIEAS